MWQFFIIKCVYPKHPLKLIYEKEPDRLACFAARPVLRLQQKRQK